MNDETRKGQSELKDAKLQSKVKSLQQQQLDYFAANNDVVMYQMKLGKEDD